MSNSTLLYPRVRVDQTAAGVVSQAGSVLLIDTIRRCGVDRVLSQALAPWRPRLAVHDRGKVLLDLAIALALGGDCLADITVLRAERGVFGPVASDPTVSRTIDRLAADADRVLAAIGEATSVVRQQVWALAGEASPIHAAAADSPVVIDLDATLVTAHSDKQHAAPTYTGPFPLLGVALPGGVVTATYVPGMAGVLGEERDLASLVVPRIGAVVAVVAVDDLWEPVRLVGAGGVVVGAVRAFLQDLDASGRSVATQRSYAMDLLRWLRFCWAIDVPWNRATRVEARDFCRWLLVRERPSRTSGSADLAVRGEPNAVTGRAGPGDRYAVATRAHSETVLRGFYEFHREAGSGPMVNPFPLVRAGGGRPNAHHNPMEPFRNERVGLYRPRLPRRVPRCIPDELFNRLFAELGSHRDRALVALWVSTGARASELLGVRRGDVDPGQQLVTVVRKGSRALQQLPASPDAFVWLRLYQATLDDAEPAGCDDPLWLTLRRPWRPLTYPAARAMFGRAGGALGANWTLHDLRHTAAYRMARDPLLPLTDVQWVLGHAQLSTTQIYLTPVPGATSSPACSPTIAEVSASPSRPPIPSRWPRALLPARLVGRAVHPTVPMTTTLTCDDATPGRDTPIISATPTRSALVVGPGVLQLRRSYSPRPRTLTWPQTQLPAAALLTRCWRLRSP